MSWLKLHKGYKYKVDFYMYKWNNKTSSFESIQFSPGMLICRSQMELVVFKARLVFFFNEPPNSTAFLLSTFSFTIMLTDKDLTLYGPDRTTEKAVKDCSPSTIRKCVKLWLDSPDLQPQNNQCRYEDYVGLPKGEIHQKLQTDWVNAQQ